MDLSQLHTDTIAAIATAPGRGGVGIVRVSGPKAKEIALTMLGFEPKVRYAHYCITVRLKTVTDRLWMKVWLCTSLLLIRSPVKTYLNYRDTADLWYWILS